MPQFVHVARILPGGKEIFLDNVARGFTAGRELFRSMGIRRITSFWTPEVADDEDGLLVTVYEADDASAIERLYANELVMRGEQYNHGRLVAPHNHDAVPTNVAFLDLDLR